MCACGTIHIFCAFCAFFALLAPHLAEKKRDLMSLLTPGACAGVHVVRVEAHDSNALLS